MTRREIKFHLESWGIPVAETAFSHTVKPPFAVYSLRERRRGHDFKNVLADREWEVIIGYPAGEPPPGAPLLEELKDKMEILLSSVEHEVWSDYVDNGRLFQVMYVWEETVPL